MERRAKDERSRAALVRELEKLRDELLRAVEVSRQAVERIDRQIEQTRNPTEERAVEVEETSEQARRSQ